MKKGKRLLTVVTSGFLAMCMTIAPLTTGFTNVTAFASSTYGDVGLEKVPDPIDPQSWQANKDRGWDKFVPNPVINWLTDLKTEGLANPKAIRDNSTFGTTGTINRPIRGAIILAEFIDQPFITSQPIGSDKFGFKKFKVDQPGVYEDNITQNPMLNHTDRDTLGQWWADYLNKQLAMNHGANIDEFWRENTYGKWATELIPFGPYVLNGTELQYGGLAAADRPPSLRLTGSNTGALMEAVSLARAGADGKAAFDPDDFDFFFVIHAGYDESGTWLPFGMMQWSANTREEAKTVVPDILGPKAKMTELEKLFTEKPELVERLVTKRNSTNGISASQFIQDEAAKIAAMRAAGTLNQYEFKFPKEDWDWATANGNSAPTRYVAWTAWAAKAAIWSSSSGGGATAGLSYTSPKYGGTRYLAYSQQGENDGMATFAHEFGHISALGDNYGNPYTDRASAKTEPWELMSRGSFAGPFGDQARWTVPGVEAGSVPVHFLGFNKLATNSYDPGDVLVVTNEQLASRTPVVAEIVARNIPLNNRKTEASPDGVYKWLEDDYGLVSPNYYKAIQLNFGSGAWADQAGATANRDTTGFSWNQASAARMFVEVVQRTGYDSYTPDDGVIISRNDRVVDSHLTDIALIDYVQKDGFGPGKDDYASHTLGSMAQLYDAAFKVGKSTTDTGYYKSIYDPADPNYDNEVPRYYAGEGNLSWQKAMLKPGSVIQWEDRNDRPIASGDTVNEWHDPYNKLSFYILDKHLTQGKYGDFLSYQVGVLHDEGVAAGGELKVEKGKLSPATAGRVAVQEFNITKTGGAQDIIKIELGGTLGYKTTILNDLFAISDGETITVPVYIEVPETVGFAAASVPTVTLTSLNDEDLTLTVISQSDRANKDTATVDDAANQSTVNRLIVTTDKAIVSKNEYFNVNVKFMEKVSSNTAILTYTFDTDKFEYRGLGLAPGVKELNTVVNGGTLKITVMVDDYNTLDYGNVLFSAKDDIDLTNKANEILVNVQCVEKDANGEKTIKGADGGTAQLTGLPGDTNGDGKVDLIDLSNMIDWYGFNTETPDWETKYVFYDFNRTGGIDISDITKVAQLINL